MANEHENDYMDEGDQFKTPIALDKKQKRKKKKMTEAEDQDEDGTIEITVKQVSERPGRVPPIVAYFASGYDPSAQSADGESPKVTVYKHKAESRKRLQVVVSPPGSTVEFVGSNYTGEQAARQTCVYTLGVLDKETNTLRILPIAHNKVIRLEPRVKVKQSINSEAEEIEVNKEEVSEAIKRNKLTEKFGAKIDMSRDRKRQALKLRDDSEAQKSLGGKLDEVDVNTGALQATNALVARNIPPYNESATTPKDAYPIEKIIENREWAYLQDIYRLLQQETEAAATDSYPAFVRNRLYKLRDMKDEMEKETVSGILTLLTHLVKFKDINSLDGRDSAKDHKFPGIIREKCNSLFKDSDSTRIPVDKINLLISYVLVLALHVDKFKTDPEDIAKDLRMSKGDLRKHFENLGCKFSVENKVTVATLPVPLIFKQINRKRKRV